MDGTPGVTGAGIEVSGLSVRYGDLVALDAVHLSVAPGEVVGLIGPNGAGKTSLIECAEGLRKPSAGTVRVAGLDPWTDRARVAALAGVQLQHSSYPTRVSVAEICRLFASFYQDPADHRDLLAEFDLLESAGRQVTRLSGGQRQRLSLVLALLGRPRVVFLDELTTGLDPAARRDVWEGLRRRNAQGLTVLLTSHHMDEVEYLCDRVAVLVRGRFVATDSVSALIRAYAGDGERLVAEDVGTRAAELTTQLSTVDGVRVSPAGNRLRLDVTGPAARAAAEAVLARAGVTARTLAASLDDVYLALTGQSTVDGVATRTGLDPVVTELDPVVAELDPLVERSSGDVR